MFTHLFLDFFQLSMSRSTCTYVHNNGHHSAFTIRHYALGKVQEMNNIKVFVFTTFETRQRKKDNSRLFKTCVKDNYRFYNSLQELVQDKLNMRVVGNGSCNNIGRADGNSKPLYDVTREKELNKLKICKTF